jgi:hypothetical protein
LFSGQTATIAGVLVDYGRAPEAIRDEVLKKVTAALGLIERFDPRRLQQLANRGTRILVLTPLGGHQYDSAGDVIELEARMVASATAFRLAISIVHEAAHARIASLSHRRRQNTWRVERRCVEEEIAFARRLTKDQQWLDEWVPAKRAQLQDPWWGFRKSIGRFAQVVVEHHCDAWYAKLLRHLA